MTATTFRSSAQLGNAHVTMAGVLRAEWIKLRSLRSTWYSLLVALLITDGLGTLFAGLHAHRIQNDVGPGGKVFFDATEVSLRGIFLAQLAIGVLGVLVITGEYSTGMIRSSLSAVPRRQPVLIAKAVVFAVPVFILSLIATLVGFLLGQVAQSSTHLQASLSTPGAWRAIIGAALYLTLIGLLGVALGFLVRNTAGAIASLFGVVLVAPLLANALPSPYSTDVQKYLPLSFGTRVIQTTDGDPSLLAPWTGIGMLVLYVVVVMIAGAVMLNSRDA